MPTYSQLPTTYTPHMIRQTTTFKFSFQNTLPISPSRSIVVNLSTNTIRASQLFDHTFYVNFPSKSGTRQGSLCTTHISRLLFMEIAYLVNNLMSYQLISFIACSFMKYYSTKIEHLLSQVSNF